MAEDPSDTIRGINAALRRAVIEGLPAPYVQLSWHHYAHVLALKGIDWKPSDMTYYARHENRPLRSYFVFPLFLANANASASMVLSKLPSGQITGWAVVPIKRMPN